MNPDLTSLRDTVLDDPERFLAPDSVEAVLKQLGPKVGITMAEEEGRAVYAAQLGSNVVRPLKTEEAKNLLLTLLSHQRFAELSLTQQIARLSDAYNECPETVVDNSDFTDEGLRLYGNLVGIKVEGRNAVERTFTVLANGDELPVNRETAYEIFGDRISTQDTSWRT